MPSMDALSTEMLAFKPDKACQSAKLDMQLLGIAPFLCCYQYHPNIPDSIDCTTPSIQSVRPLPNAGARTKKPVLVVRIQNKTSHMVLLMEACRTELYINRPDVHAKAH